MTLVEMQAQLIERGASVGIDTVHRLFILHGITRKKVWVRERAGPSRRPETTSALVTCHG